MCAFALAHMEPDWLFVITPFVSFPLYLLVYGVSKKLIKRNSHR